MGTGKCNAGGNPASIPSSVEGGGGGGVEILLVASCYLKRDKLWPDEPLGAYVDLHF